MMFGFEGQKEKALGCPTRFHKTFTITVAGPISTAGKLLAPSGLNLGKWKKILTNLHSKRVKMISTKLHSKLVNKTLTKLHSKRLKKILRKLHSKRVKVLKKLRPKKPEYL
jgi:hypothetical protein